MLGGHFFQTSFSMEIASIEKAFLTIPAHSQRVVAPNTL
jgi:hypothetical protein